MRDRNLRETSYMKSQQLGFNELYIIGIILITKVLGKGDIVWIIKKELTKKLIISY